MIIDELNEDGTVAKRLGDLFEENHGLNVEDEEEFRQHGNRSVYHHNQTQYQEIRQVKWGNKLLSLAITN